MELARDKKLHLAAGVFAGVFGCWLLDGLLAGFAFAVIVGVGKELWDHFSGKGHPEVADAVWTAAGGAVGVGLYWLIAR